jgi:hypothetical protein
MIETARRVNGFVAMQITTTSSMSANILTLMANLYITMAFAS